MPRTLSLWALSASLLLSGVGMRADAPISAASQLKAVFLFNFAQFLTWPSAAFSDAHAPIVIGIIGEDPFGPYLDALVKDEKIRDRPIIVRRYQKVEEATSCHILFVSRSEIGNLDRILPQLKSLPILTVGEEESFTRHGGMVGFVTQPNGKIGLWIDNTEAEEAALTISSRLLAHATLVPAPRK